MGILDLLKGTKTVDQIAGDIAAAETRRAELDAELDAIQSRRAALLLDADGDDALDRVDRDSSLVFREIDRVDATLAELQRRLAAGRENDRLAALDAAHARAIHHQAKEKSAIERYSAAAARLADVVIEAAAHSALREAENAALRAGGDTRQVLSAASLIVTDGKDWHAADALLQRVRLPDAARPHTDIFPNRQIGATWDAVQRAIEKARQ